jgi:hypothetical protein
MREYLDAHGKGKNAVKTCRNYRLSTSPYLKFMKKNMNAIAGYDFVVRHQTCMAMRPNQRAASSRRVPPHV